MDRNNGHKPGWKDDSSSENKALDDELVDFTDDILSGKPASKLQAPGDDPQLLDLKRMVLRLKEAGEPRQPSREMAQRIHTNLVEAYQHDPLAQGAEGKKDRPGERMGMLERLKKLSRPQVFALQLGVAFVTLLALVLLIKPDSSTLPGAAKGQVSPIQLVAGIIILAGIGVLFLLRHKE